MTTESKPAPSLLPEDAVELLPWYVTGRVGRDERQAIEAMLKSSAELRQQLEAVKQQRQAVQEATDAVGAPRPEALTRLLSEIEVTRQRSRIETSAGPGFLARLFGLEAGRRPVLQFAMAAACVVIVVQAAALYRTMESGTSSYSTASAPVAASQAVAGPSLIISLEPSANMEELGALLDDVGATIVDGPKPGLSFVLALKSGDVDAALARLRARPDLILKAEQRN